MASWTFSRSSSASTRLPRNAASLRLSSLERGEVRRGDHLEHPVELQFPLDVPLEPCQRLFGDAAVEDGRHLRWRDS